jgi:hypothetical protein
MFYVGQNPTKLTKSIFSAISMQTVFVSFMYRGPPLQALRDMSSYMLRGKNQEVRQPLFGMHAGIPGRLERDKPHVQAASPH